MAEKAEKVQKCCVCKGAEQEMEQCTCGVFCCQAPDEQGCGEKHREECVSVFQTRLKQTREAHGAGSMETADAAMALGRVQERC
mmetsp:Transcript_3598/g.8316  ORF Transcript_3598/g.8316 Transcript_3598/m.8316 type:complete len:84 (-) Transcript_3598:8-259(-)